MTIFQEDCDVLRFRNPPNTALTEGSTPDEVDFPFEANEQIPFRRSRNPSSSPTLKKTVRVKNMSFGEYFKAELTRGYVMELEEERYAARREKVYAFMLIPFEVERLMGFGFFQCADAFLFLFTFLPLRCLFALYNYCMRKFHQFAGGYKGLSMPSADKCDLLKILIFSICVLGFSYIDTSVLYHVVKSQSVIKLYIFFNMLEVGDRLFASFVQDTLDALFLTATEKTEKRSKMGVLGHLALTLISVFLHALVILLQGTTLSVAINSSNRSLLTVMMSNNFVELKGSVFKKFDKINLFQVSCSDIRERFHLAVLLVIVCLQTMREYSWAESQFWILFPDVIIVLTAEVVVDWLKHAFITRFNEIPADVYREYTLSLAYDLAQTKQKRAFSDHSDMVGRRLGFVPLPLAIVLARIFRPILHQLTPSTFILLLLGYLALASFRFLNSIILLGKACDLIDKHMKLTPKHQIQDESASKGSLESTEDSLLTPRKTTRTSRSVASQPTTRTPSPSRMNSAMDESIENIKENETLGPFKRFESNGNNNKEKFFRSKSASHTPRPSIVGVLNDSNNSWKLGDAPESFPDASTALLMANSAVSILSVSLNEEMLRTQKETNPEVSDSKKKNIAPPKPARKHSLGNSDINNELNPIRTLRENSLTRVSTLPSDKEPHSPESPDFVNISSDLGERGTTNSSQESLNCEEKTLIEREPVSERLNLDKENSSPKRGPRTTSESSTQDENATGEAPKRKKKGLLSGWLSSH